MFSTLFSGIAVAMLAATISAAHADDGVKVLNFGIISTESSKNLKQDWQPVLDEMSKRIGIKVNGFFASDYAGIIEGMRFGKVQMAWLGNKAALEAVDRADGEVFAHVLNPDGSAGYYSLVGVQKDSPNKSIEDILKNAKSLTFGIGDPNSTSGYLLPNYYIFARHNVDAKRAFKVIRTSNHEANILAVANKQIDAAVFASDTMARIEERQPAVAKEVRIVWKSPLIAADPLVWRKDLPADAKNKIKDFFINYGKSGSNAAQEKAQLAKLEYSGFKASDDAQLKPVRQLELFKQKGRLEADASLNAADKKTRLDDINRKLTDLGTS